MIDTSPEKIWSKSGWLMTKKDNAKLTIEVEADELSRANYCRSVTSAAQVASPRLWGEKVPVMLGAEAAGGLCDEQSAGVAEKGRNAQRATLNHQGLGTGATATRK